MKQPTSRLFSCLRCHRQTIICSYCDRGQLYCSQQCANTARRGSCRLAENRYQKTLRGKRKHALRQQRYRARLKKKVTDHGSHSPTPNVLLNPINNKTTEPAYCDLRCCFCKKPVSTWIRQGFLRHALTETIRAGP